MTMPNGFRAPIAAPDLPAHVGTHDTYSATATVVGPQFRAVVQLNVMHRPAQEGGIVLIIGVSEASARDYDWSDAQRAAIEEAQVLLERAVTTKLTAARFQRRMEAYRVVGQRLPSYRPVWEQP